MYEEVKLEIAAGGRAFIVYPLIEESATERFVDVKAAEEEYSKLQQSMKLGRDVKCGLLHSRMSSDEKHAAVLRFCSGDTPVLVSTSVVEVGPYLSRLYSANSADSSGFSPSLCPVPQSYQAAR